MEKIQDGIQEKIQGAMNELHIDKTHWKKYKITDKFSIIYK